MFFILQASATDEAIALLLFEWAVSKYRVGKFRALAVAQILQRRQGEILEEVRIVIWIHNLVLNIDMLLNFTIVFSGL